VVPGAPAEARVRQLARFTAALERAGYHPTQVGPFVVYARLADGADG